eukprot:gene213-4798_t
MIAFGELATASWCAQCFNDREAMGELRIMAEESHRISKTD